MSEYDDFSDLNELEPAWVSAPEDPNEPIPDGTYQVRIERFELTRTKKTNVPMINWVFEVLGPTCEGRKLFDHQVIHGKDADEKRRRLSFVKQRLHVLGCVPEKLGDLADENFRALLIDRCVELTVKTKESGDNVQQNIYFRKALELSDVSPKMTGRGF